MCECVAFALRVNYFLGAIRSDAISSKLHCPCYLSCYYLYSHAINQYCVWQWQRQAKTITSFSSASNQNHQTRAARASSPLATHSAFSAAAIFNWELQQKFYFLQQRSRVLCVYIELHIVRAPARTGRLPTDAKFVPTPS
jgi:hypothetical protein